MPNTKPSVELTTARGQKLIIYPEQMRIRLIVPNDKGPGSLVYFDGNHRELVKEEPDTIRRLWDEVLTHHDDVA